MTATAEQVETPPVPRRWTREEYYRMAEQGLFQNEHVELIEGEIYQMAPQKDARAQAITLAQYRLQQVLGSGFVVRVRLPMRLSATSEPEPDLVVVRGTPRSVTQHPTTAELVVEVSDTTLPFDRTITARLYAEAGVADYWIVNLANRTLEVHRNPLVDAGGEKRYGDVRTLSAADSIAPLAHPQAPIAVADLLP